MGTVGVVVANKPGKLYKLTVTNDNDDITYVVQVHDKAYAPVATDVPIWERILPYTADGFCDVDLDFGLAGLHCANGLSIAISTTTGVLTLAAADDCTAYALYAAQIAAPAISSIAPDEGADAGGDTVVITGRGFGGATGVTFGGDAATNVVVDSDTQITCDTPAHAAGAVDVIVEAPSHLGGNSQPLVNGFTFTA